MIIGLYTNQYFSKSPQGPLANFHHAVCYKSNPRSREYMANLFQSQFPDAQFIDIDNNPHWQRMIEENSHVFLLYPDSIGLGFGKIEKLLVEHPALFILNGRKRLFPATILKLLKFKFKRFLERTMLLEFLLLPLFIMITPFILIYDLLRGRI